MSFIAIIIVPLLVAGVITYGLLTEIVTGNVSRLANDGVGRISMRLDGMAQELGGLINQLSQAPQVQRRSRMRQL